MKEKSMAFSGGLDTSFFARYLTVDKWIRSSIHAIVIQVFFGNGTGCHRKTRFSAGSNYANVHLLSKMSITRIVSGIYFMEICVKNGTYPLSVSSGVLSRARYLLNMLVKICAKY